MAAANSEKIDKTGMVGKDGDGGEGSQFQFGTCHRAQHIHTYMTSTSLSPPTDLTVQN